MEKKFFKTRQQAIDYAIERYPADSELRDTHDLFSDDYLEELCRKSIGAQVKAERCRRHMSLREFAKVAGVGFTHVQRIEDGTYNFTLRTLHRLSRNLGIEFKISALPR